MILLGKKKIEINIEYHFHIGDNIEQRAEGGGQILRNVGANANQGGQIAVDHSSTANNRSQFADGNGRSGIAGRNNDELGGQQGIKVRDSRIRDSILESTEQHNEGVENLEEAMEQFRLPRLSRLNRNQS